MFVELLFHYLFVMTFLEFVEENNFLLRLLNKSYEVL